MINIQHDINIGVLFRFFIRGAGIDAYGEGGFSSLSPPPLTEPPSSFIS